MKSDFIYFNLFSVYHVISFSVRRKSAEKAPSYRKSKIHADKKDKKEQ